MMKVPGGIVMLLSRYFGSESLPLYNRTAQSQAEDPYRELIGELADSWVVNESTDLNYDLGNEIALGSDVDTFVLRLSWVGPFAVVLGDGGRYPANNELLNRTLAKHSVFVLAQELLERTVTYWSPEFEAPLYEFLFEFDSGVPWINQHG